MPKGIVAPFAIDKGCYKMAAKKESEAEIIMYGEIVESRPYDYWTGREVPGDFIIQKEFLDDLNTAINSGIKKLTLRINSLGGDADVSIVIHNRLREIQKEGIAVTCIVDGMAMSGGSLIMCGCDNVRVNPSSIIMIHKCWKIYYGAFNADDLREEANSHDAYDKAQSSIYTRKTGLSETKILHMMKENTYMTGAEAVEKGFADELIEDSKTNSFAASANGRSIFVNGKTFHLARGMKVPDIFPIMEHKNVISTEASDDINTSSGSDTDNKKEGGQSPMAKNLEELRAENSELASQVESDVRAAVSAEHATDIENRVAEERRRISEIDEIAALYDDETVRNAKYGEHPCTAQEMSFRAAQQAAKTGSAFMANAKEDAKNGANGVPSAAEPSDDGTEKTPAQKQAEADSTIHALLHKEEGKS